MFAQPKKEIDMHGNLLEIVKKCKLEVDEYLDENNLKNIKEFVDKFSGEWGAFPWKENQEHYLITIFNMYIDYCRRKGYDEVVTKLTKNILKIDGYYIPNFR